MKGDPSKLPCGDCGRARPPEPGAEVYTSSCCLGGCGYPLPKPHEKDPIFVLRLGARYLVERSDGLTRDQSAEFLRLVEAVGAELEQLRAERRPFRVLMDKALDTGVFDGDRLDAALGLAAQLGFRDLPLDLDLLVRLGHVVSVGSRRVRLNGLRLTLFDTRDVDADVVLSGVVEAPRTRRRVG